VRDVPLAADKQPDLAVQLGREGAERASKIRRDDRPDRDAPSEEPFERRPLASLESSDVAADGRYGFSRSFPLIVSQGVPGEVQLPGAFVVK
jgi:hypothetical protein